MDPRDGLDLLRKVIALEGEIRCKVCGNAILEPCVLCAACETPHHPDCWTYSGGCSVYGCRKTDRVDVTLPEKELEALRREVRRRQRQVRAWQVAAGTLTLALGAGMLWIFSRPASAPTPPVVVQAEERSVTEPALPPRQEPPPPVPGPVALDVQFLCGSPTTPQDAVKSAFADGTGELKMISISLQPVGAYAVRFAFHGLERALATHPAHLHLTVPGAPEALEPRNMQAREVLETWTYRGRDTPLPAARTVPLEVVSPGEWDVTGAVRRQLEAGQGSLSVLMIPSSMDFQVARAMRDLENTATAWMTFGQGTRLPPPRRVLRLPDLVPTGIEMRDDHVVVQFKNQGEGTSGGTFHVSLGPPGQAVLGSSDGDSIVPAPGASAATRFRFSSFRGLRITGSGVPLTAEVDWSDQIRESDETNNKLTCPLTFPEAAQRARPEGDE